VPTPYGEPVVLKTCCRPWLSSTTTGRVSRAEPVVEVFVPFVPEHAAARPEDRDAGPSLSSLDAIGVLRQSRKPAAPDGT